MGPATAPSNYWRPENIGHPSDHCDEEIETAASILMDIHRKDAKGLRYLEVTEGPYTRYVPEGDAYWAIKNLRRGEIYSGSSIPDDNETLTPSRLQDSRIFPPESADTEDSGEETEDDVEHERIIVRDLPTRSQVTPRGHEDTKANCRSLPTLSVAGPLGSPKTKGTSPRLPRISNSNKFRMYQQEELGISDAFAETSFRKNKDRILNDLKKSFDKDISGGIFKPETFPLSNRKRKSACTIESTKNGTSHDIDDNTFSTFTRKSRTQSLTINSQITPGETSLPTPPDSGKNRTFDSTAKSQPQSSSILRNPAKETTGPTIASASPANKRRKLVGALAFSPEASTTPLIIRRSNRRTNGQDNETQMTLEEQIAAREREAEREGMREVKEREVSKY